MRGDICALSSSDDVLAPLAVWSSCSIAFCVVVCFLCLFVFCVFCCCLYLLFFVLFCFWFSVFRFLFFQRDKVIGLCIGPLPVDFCGPTAWPSLKRGSSDSEIHAQWDAGVEKVLRGKRIALWKEMFASMEYEDIGVVDEFCSGATLTGPTCPTGLWAKQFTPATLTEDELRQQAAAQRCSLTYSQVAFFSEEIAKSVWEQALEEVAKGELEGPISLEDVSPDIPISRRFGVEQGGKIRCVDCVDDFSASGVNAAAQPLENPKFLLWCKLISHEKCGRSELWFKERIRTVRGAPSVKEICFHRCGGPH